MPESIPAPLIIDTLKDTFREARRGTRAPSEPLGWIPERPDTHQKTVLAALDKGARPPRRYVRDRGRGRRRGAPASGSAASRAMLMIQHAGLYASVNTLRGRGDGRARSRSST